MRRRRFITLKTRRRLTKSLRAFLLSCRSWHKPLVNFFAKNSIFAKNTWTRRFSLIALAVIVAASSFAIFNRPNAALGQTYSLAQNDWSGGVAPDTVTAPASLTGWNKYASASGLTAGVGSMALPPNQGTLSESFTATANEDIANTTGNWNASAGELQVNSNPGTDVSAAVSSMLPSDYFISNTIYDPVHNALYLYGSNNSSGPCTYIKYNINTGTATDLSPSILSVIPTCHNGSIGNSVYYPATGEIYASAYGATCCGTAYYYKINTANDAITDMTSVMAPAAAGGPTGMGIDTANGIIYFAGQSNSIGKYVIGGSATSLSTAYQSAIGFKRIFGFQWAPDQNTLYFGGESGMFGKYSPTGGFTNLNSVTGGALAANFQYALAYDSVHSVIYMGGANTFVSYSGAGTFADLSSLANSAMGGVMIRDVKFSQQMNGIFLANERSSTSTEAFYSIDGGSISIIGLAKPAKSVAIDSSGTTAFFGGDRGAFLVKVPPSCSTCIATSLTLDATTQNIASATLTKQDTVGTGTIVYQLSNDGGATYNAVTPGSLYAFSTIGSDLRFKITMTGNATVQDLSIAYNYFAANGTLTSSRFDSTDAANIVSRLVWDETAPLPAGVTVTASLRTADTSTNLTGAWTDLTNASASCSKVGTTVTCSAAALPAGLQDGNADRWFQYKINIASDGRNTATVSSFGIQFVVNAAPEARNVTAVQNSDGTVTVHYEVRDADTASGSPANRGHVTPSFEYWDGSVYQPIVSLAVGDAGAKAVAADGGWNNAVYTATWTPAADYAGHFMNNTAKIRVTASDGEGANSTGLAESPFYTLDTAAPLSTSVTVDASTTPATVHLAATDDNGITMKVSSSDPTLATTASEPFAAAKTMTLSEGATVYAKFTDAFQNSTGIQSALVPSTPTAVMIQDTSNILSDPRLYRLFVAWKVVAGSFATYRVHRSNSLDNPAGWPEVASIAARATNYYIDTNVNENGHYYYYVDTVDPSGNVSFRSTIVDGIADGAQSGGEGGGGIGPAPVISNVSPGAPQATTATITWNTDVLSDSTVSYSTSPSTFSNSVSIGSLVNNDSGVGRHEVILTGLAPETTYYFRVSSKDIYDQTTTDANGGTGYSFATPGGPVISNTSVVETTNTTARVSWTTNVPASSQLVHSVHADMAQPTFTTGTSNSTIDHVVNLTNLSPGTMYFFYVSSVDVNSSSTSDKRVVGGVPQYYSFTTTNDMTPPAISAISVRAQPTSADIIWTTDKVSDSQVEFGLTTAYGSTTSVDPTLTNRHVMTITGLSPQTAYNFRIHSRGNNSVLGMSSNQVFTAPAAGDATPPAVTGVFIASLSLNSATVNWTTDEPATSYVDYGVTTAVGSSAGFETLAKQHSVTLDGLLGGTAYYYRVRSADASGNTTIDNNNGSYYVVTTAVDTTAPVISDADSIILMNSFRAIWSTNELADSQLEYGPDAGYGSSTALDESLVLDHAVAVSGLNAATTYHYRIVTKDASGNPAAGPDRVVTTAAEADHTPPVIAGPAAGSISRTTATVTWTTDEKSSSEVEYGPNTTFAYSASNVNDNTINHSVDLIGLTPGALYYFKVVSADGSGNIASDDNHGAGYSFTTTVDTTPPVISGVTASLVADTSAVIIWSTNEPANAQIAYGPTTAYGSQTALDTTLSTAHSVTITGLTAKTQYLYKVVSADAYMNATTDDNTGAGYTFTTTATPGASASYRQSNIDTTPPVIMNLKVGSIGKNVATVEWNTDEAANGVVKYGKTIAYGTLGGSIDEKISSHKVFLNDLSPGTIYHFIAVSSDASGNQATSTDRLFATLNEDGTVVPVPPPEETSPSTPVAPTNTNTPVAPETPPTVDAKTRAMDLLASLVGEPGLSSVPEDFLTSTMNDIIDRVIHAPAIVGVAPRVNVEGTTAKIGWITDKKATSTIAIATDGEYKPAQAEPYVTVVSTPNEFATGHEVVVKNLLSATTYHFQVRSKGLVGGESRSKDAVFQTTSDLPVITDVMLSDVVDSAATVQWKTNVPTNTLIEYRDIAAGTTLTQGDTAMLRDHKFDLNKLASGTAYKITITSADEFGNEAKSAPLTLSTSKDNKAPEISKVSSSSTLYPGKDSRVQTIVSWNTDEPATSHVWFQEGLAKDAEQVEVPEDQTMVTAHTVVITKFRPATVYKFHVESADPSSNQAKSNDFLILTPQQKASVLDVIIGNFEQVFGWTKKIGG